MEIFKKEKLKKELLRHPYESNPAYFSKINPFYYSDDKNFIAGYYEAPPGWFEVEIKGFYQLEYILEGEVEIIANNKKFNLKNNDLFLLEDGDKLKWIIMKTLKTFLFIYPSNTDLLYFLKNLKNNKF